MPLAATEPAWWVIAVLIGGGLAAGWLANR